MSAVKRALSFFKNPPFSSLSAVFVLADSHKLVWAAACLASGILLHEQIPASALALFAAGLVVLAGMAGLLRRLSLCAGILAGLAGLMAAEAEIRRADHVMLAEPVTASVSGIVQTRAVRSSGRLSLTLTELTSPDPRLAMLLKIRFSMDNVPPLILPGDRVDARVRLFSLSPPSFAGRPDYARNQYMSGLSATGFAYQARLVHQQAETSWPVRLNRWRHQFAATLNSRMGAPYGGVAAALLVGVRDDISAPIYDTFRASGLAHLLAISGLHMGLFCLSVLLVIRAGFACFPGLCQRWSPRRLAAIAALLSGFGYLLISGGPVSAVRAFVMAMIILLTSALASLVTVPFIAYHFGQFTLLGILANLVALPLTAFLIMPAGILVLLSVPFGLFGPAETLMVWPLLVLLKTADLFSVLPYAGSFLAPPPVLMLGLFFWALIGLFTPGRLYRTAGLAGMVLCSLIWTSRPDYQAALFFVRGPVLAIVTPSGEISTSAPVSAWWQDNLRLSLGRAEISNSLTNTPEPTSELKPEFGPKSPAASLRGQRAIYLVTRRSQLSAACDSQAMLVITLAEPLYPCASGRPLLYVPQTHRGGKRESWLFLLPKTAEQAVPPPLSNLRVQKRSWRR